MKKLLYDESVDEFIRGDALHVLGELWKDGRYQTDEWKNTLVDLIEKLYNQEGEYLYSEAICHFVEFRDLIHDEIARGRTDLMMYGNFAGHMNLMYEDIEPRFITKPFGVKPEIGRWFDITGMKTAHSMLDGDMDDFIDRAERKLTETLPAVSGKTVGRDDPCPCGSGRK